LVGTIRGRNIDRNDRCDAKGEELLPCLLEAPAIAGLSQLDEIGGMCRHETSGDGQGKEGAKRHVARIVSRFTRKRVPILSSARPLAADSGGSKTT
jgi:hypothetical protein